LLVIRTQFEEGTLGCGDIQQAPVKKKWEKLGID
jgi:hypothetical protein